jgi:hypothetical protein
MLRNFLALAMVFAGFTASADQQTFLAAGAGATAGLYQALGSIYLATGDQFFVKTIVPKEVVTALDREAIGEIMTAVNDSPLERFGIGNMGGARISLTLNQAHLDAAELIRTVDQIGRTKVQVGETSSAAIPDDKITNAKAEIYEDVVKDYKTLKDGAKPRDIMVIKYADDASLKAELEKISASGAGVVKIEFSGLLRRVAGTTTKAVLTGFFAVPAASNLIHAAQFTLNSTSGPKNWITAQDHAQAGYVATAFNWIFNTSDAVYFKLEEQKALK